MAAEPAPAQAGVYVYGIFPPDVELAGEQSGVGDPPGPVRLVRASDLAALVSDVDLSGPLGTPQDLRTHQELLDRSVVGLPVLPMRFGAVLASDDAVADELLEAHREEFTAALEGLEGRSQYVVKGRYVEEAILAEVLAENPEAERLRGEIRDADAAAPAATRDARIALGELISQAVTSKRDANTQELIDRTAGLCAAGLIRDPTHDLDAVHVAFLIDDGRAGELDEVIADLASTWKARVELRVLGPMAAYDFVATADPGG